MKNLFAITIIALITIAGNTQAGEVDNYLLQKQKDAARTQMHSEYMVKKLRSLPEGVGYVVNTTAMVDTGQLAMTPPTPAELDAMATASGNRLAAQKTAPKPTK